MCCLNHILNQMFCITAKSQTRKTENMTPVLYKKNKSVLVNVWFEPFSNTHRLCKSKLSVILNVLEDFECFSALKLHLYSKVLVNWNCL